MDRTPFLKLAPDLRLTMTFNLSQALKILQMPQQELSEWLLEEIEKNPLLELKTRCTKKPFEGDVPSPITLYEHLQSQIREHFSHEKERMVAEELLSHLDEKGFLSTSLDSISELFQIPIEPILSVLQTFDPPGIFARNLQEALLLQLKAKGKADSLASTLVKTCYDDLLHGRYALIKKRLGSFDLKKAIDELGHLSLRPTQVFIQEPMIPIHPDLQIQKVEGGWTIELIEDELPQFYLQTEYLDLKTESNEEKEALSHFKTQAKWIFRSLGRRRELLKEMSKILISKQAAYLDQKGPLVPLTIKELAEKLQVHESTISRALSGKYASTPRGLIPLRSLISADPHTMCARKMLENLIQKENKESPLTDDQLAQELLQKGFPLARRTIAKYRSQLNIGSAAQRKNIGY